MEMHLFFSELSAQAEAVAQAKPPGVVMSCERFLAMSKLLSLFSRDMSKPAFEEASGIIENMGEECT